MLPMFIVISFVSSDFHRITILLDCSTSTESTLGDRHVCVNVPYEAWRGEGQVPSNDGGSASVL